MGMRKWFRIDDLLVSVLWLLGAASPGVMIPLRKIIVHIEPIAMRFNGKLPLPIRYLPGVGETTLYLGWGFIACGLLVGLMVEQRWRERDEHLHRMCTYTAMVALIISLLACAFTMGTLILVLDYHSSVITAILGQWP